MLIKNKIFQMYMATTPIRTTAYNLVDKVKNVGSTAKTTALAGIAALGLYASPLDASIMTGNNLVNQDGTGFSGVSTEGNFGYTVREAYFNSDFFVIDYVLKNPFASANIDTYSINTTKLNTGLGADQAAIDTNQQYTILDVGAGGEVFEKWIPTSTPTEIALSASGLGKDPWTATNSFLDESYGQLRIRKTEFDGNNNVWSQADVDAGLDYFITQDNISSLLGTANAGINSSLDENGIAPVVGQYVVPEPTSIAYMVLGGLALGLGLSGRKRKPRLPIHK